MVLNRPTQISTLNMGQDNSPEDSVAYLLISGLSVSRHRRHSSDVPA